MSENNVQITMTQVDTLCLMATTVSGIDFFVEASPGLGGSGNNPSPLAHFLGALGGCTSIKTKLGLTRKGRGVNLSLLKSVVHKEKIHLRFLRVFTFHLL